MFANSKAPTIVVSSMWCTGMIETGKVVVRSTKEL
jgi:hypothetical protein